MYRVIQWATGSMGRTSLRRIIDHPDLELAGVFVYDERKSGRDAGELARRPPTGVIATHRMEDILALDADVVIHTPRLTEPYERQNADVVRLLAAGCDVISTAGFHYPDAHGTAYAGPLRAACSAGGSTLAGLGLNPGFVAERLAVMLTGMCAELSSLACHELADASAMPSREFVFDLMGFGADPAVGDITRGPLAELYGALYGEVFHAVAASLGTTVASLVAEHQVTLAPEDLTIAAGVIPAGRVAATDWRWRATFADGCRMLHSVVWTADPTLQGAPRGQAAHWRIEIEGRPNVRVSMLIEDPDPRAPHMRAAADATVAIALQSIPEVCAAPPGFFTVPPLAPYRARFAPRAPGRTEPRERE